MVPSNSRASTVEFTDAEIDDSSSAAADCTVPRQVEQPVVTLNQDNSAVIVWTSR